MSSGRRTVAYVHEGRLLELPEQVGRLVDLGLDVTVVAPSRNREEAEVTEVDGVPVVGCPSQTPLRRGLAITRTPRWPDLRAYRTITHAAVRAERNRQHVEQIRFRTDVAVSRGGSSARLALLRAATLAARVQRRWIAARTGALQRAQRRQLDDRRLPARLRRRAWLAVEGDRAWQRFDASLWDRELTFGAALDALSPDIVHGVGLPVVAVAVRAGHRRTGPRPVIVWEHDAETVKDPTKARALELLEADLGRGVDHRLTSDDPADLATLYRRLLDEPTAP